VGEFSILHTGGLYGGVEKMDLNFFNIVRMNLAFGPTVDLVIIATGTASNAITITPTNLRGGSTITLNAEGETVVCLFKNSKWNVIGGHGFVVA